MHLWTALGAQRRSGFAWVCQREERGQLGEAGACSLQTVINEELAWAAGPAWSCNAASHSGQKIVGNLCDADPAACLFATPGFPPSSPTALGYLWLNPVGRPIK